MTDSSAMHVELARIQANFKASISACHSLLTAGKGAANSLKSHVEICARAKVKEQAKAQLDAEKDRVSRVRIRGAGSTTIPTSPLSSNSFFPPPFPQPLFSSSPRPSFSLSYPPLGPATHDDAWTDNLSEITIISRRSQ